MVDGDRAFACLTATNTKHKLTSKTLLPNQNVSFYSLSDMAYFRSLPLSPKIPGKFLPNSPQLRYHPAPFVVGFWPEYSAGLAEYSRE